MTESETKHTPGPWEFTGGDVWRDDRTQVCCGRGYQECCGNPDVVGGQELIAQTSEINARLIAAAPDLLEALRLVRSYIDQKGQHVRDLYPVFGLDGRRVREVVAAALSRATSPPPPLITRSDRRRR